MLLGPYHYTRYNWLSKVPTEGSFRGVEVGDGNQGYTGDRVSCTAAKGGHFKRW